MGVGSDAEIREILGLRTIAVVGCSPTPGDDAHDVPKYLHDHGYTVIPVTTQTNEVFGRTTYETLDDVAAAVDIVAVFDGDDAAAGAVSTAIDRDDVKVLWIHQGVDDTHLVSQPTDTDTRVVRNKNLKTEHQRLV